MSSHLGLDQRWRALLPQDTVVIDTARHGAAKVADVLTALPAPCRVALIGTREVRRHARRNGVSIEKEYIALPSIEQPVAITLVAPESLAWFARSVLTVPPGTVRLHALKWLAIRLIRRWPALIVHAPLGDRILIGVRG